MKYKYENLIFSENEEITRLVLKHGLRTIQAQCYNRPKTFGIDHIDNNKRIIIPGSLWHINYRHGSIRRTKKSIKKFLRKYDKQMTSK